jgi:hypothetical protein
VAKFFEKLGSGHAGLYECVRSRGLTQPTVFLRNLRSPKGRGVPDIALQSS